MTRKLSFKAYKIRPCGAWATRRSFPHKIAWIKDEFHPHGIEADVTPLPGRWYTRATWPPRGRGRGESMTSPRRIEAQLKAAQAFELWRSGLTWEQVAVRLGYANKSGPWRAVRRMFDRIDYEAWKKKA